MSAADAGEAGILAYLRHQALERRAAYIAQGRRFANLAAEALDAAWAEAFVAMCLHGDPSRIDDIDDLTAEIGLRGRPVPAHLVRHAMSDIQQRARQWLGSQVLARFSARVGAFVRGDAESRSRAPGG